MTNVIKWIIIMLALGFVTYVGYWMYAIATLGGAFDTFHTYQELIDNYKLKTKEIQELKHYIHSIVPTDKYVYIEFKDDQMLDIFHVKANGKFENNWHVEVNSHKADSLLNQLGWTKETLKILKAKLDNANCIAIASSKPCNIGFQRSGMGQYFYNLFDKPIVDSLKKEYNDSCNFILYNDTVVMEYGGGAIGPQCFPDFR